MDKEIFNVSTKKITMKSSGRPAIILVKGIVLIATISVLEKIWRENRLIKNNKKSMKNICLLLDYYLQ